MKPLTVPEGLQAPESAPQDGTMILGDFGYHSLVVAVWSPYHEEWAIANLMGINWDNTDHTELHFETEYHAHDELVGWLPYPTVKGIEEELGLAA